MTEKKFMERMIFLTEKLANVYEQQPLDEDARRGVMVEVYATQNEYKQSKRRRPWAALASCIILMMILLYIVYSILCFLLILDRS